MNKIKFISLAAGFLSAMVFTFSCSEESRDGTLTDSRDSKVYKTVKIGKQIWMAENLNYDADWNKSTVIEALKEHSEPYEGDGRLGKCYNDDPANCEKYGRLYDWAETMGSYVGGLHSFKYNLAKADLGDTEYRGICPEGWHLPSSSELSALYEYIGGDNYSPEGVNGKLKAQSGWEAGNGTDDYGFSALPGGFRLCFFNSAKLSCNESFDRLGKMSLWWTATEASAHEAKNWSMAGDNSGSFSRGMSKLSFHSVRCVKNKK
jgi:uncharacterized protein (TIGR02145 family)